MDDIDLDFFGDAMKAVGLKTIYIDEPTNISPFRPLHPTLRKCKCGFIASSHKVTEHISHLMHEAEALDCSLEARKNFWQFHGEVPLHEGDV